MKKFFKWLFNSNKKTETPTIPNKYCVKYVEDGNLYVEYSWFVYAQSEEMARYDFWDSHNSLYCDILSVTKLENPEKVK